MSKQLDTDLTEHQPGVPRGWVLTSLGSLLREPLRNGKSGRATENGHGLRTLTLTAVTNATFTDENTKLTVTDPESATDLFLEPGDIFVQRSNTPELVGSAAMFKGPRKWAIFPDLLIRVRVLDALPPSYIEALLRSPASRRHFRKAAQGIAGSMPKISQGTVEGTPVPLAPLPEQHRIVAAIETQFTRLDAAVGTLQGVKVKLEAARASVLKAAVEGRLVPTEAELARAEGRTYEPASLLLDRVLAERKAKAGKGKYKPPVEPDTEGLPELPEGWVWATADQTTQFVTSGSRGWAEFYSETGPLFIRSQDINTYRLDLSAVAHVELPSGVEGTRTRVERGDVLVIITGANVTITAWVRGDVGEAYVNQHVALCRPVLDSTSAYLHLWMMAHGGGRDQLEAAAYGAGKPGLNLTNIREVAVAVPPVAEQARIVAEVERRLSVLDALEATVERNLRRCTRLRQSILKRAFEGKLVPQDPNDEPASELLARIQAQVSRAV